jgi:predicted Rdx family selenoprotein
MALAAGVGTTLRITVGEGAVLDGGPRRAGRRASGGFPGAKPLKAFFREIVAPERLATPEAGKTPPALDRTKGQALVS